MYGDGDAVQVEAKFPRILAQAQFDVLACLHSPPSRRPGPAALSPAPAPVDLDIFLNFVIDGSGTNLNGQGKNLQEKRGKAKKM